MLAEWRKLSIHDVPNHLQLPIRVARSQLSEDLEKLPAVAKNIRDLEMYFYNPWRKSIALATRSCFFYSWARGLTTLTGDGALYKHNINDMLDQGRLGDGEEGPHYWLLVQVTRVLYGRPRHLWT